MKHKALILIGFSVLVAVRGICQDRVPYYKRLPKANYSVVNEAGEKLDALVFQNDKTIKQEKAKELFVYFKTDPKPIVIVIAIPPRLIGIPERSSTMKIVKDQLLILRESLVFTPVNVGIEKMLNEYTIADDLISFDAFAELKSFGRKIFVKKTG
ncbi:hypothetical protein [Desertivirga arenae]|uniref:hypothetical protein n=1 Tax=Desertivirga arenae TaxID=2810309 RepID=UPI001A972CB4|nr:hypothetical protein [Pedobacter sp. SYSU D00823]